MSSCGFTEDYPLAESSDFLESLVVAWQLDGNNKESE